EVRRPAGHAQRVQPARRGEHEEAERVPHRSRRVPAHLNRSIMFCAQCGKQVPDGAKFCPGCGANVQGDAAAATKPKSGAGLKLAVAGLIVVAAAAGGYVMLAPGEKTPGIEKAPAITPKPEAA